MRGIDLNKPVDFKYSSLRFFSENEYHVTRFCEHDVLVMVFEGVLRFTEDGIPYEVHPGEYHIQKSHSFQKGELPSDSPGYLYVHFLGEWADNDTTLPFEGTFDYLEAKALMDELDRISHIDTPYVHKCAIFLKLLVMLCHKEPKLSIGNEIADFINRELLNDISLEKICREFHFSKNHIINIFKKEFGVTPVKYIQDLKIKRARYLLEVTSDTLENVARSSGFNDYSHFYKVFCRESGLSPTQWRNRKQTEPLSL